MEHYRTNRHSRNAPLAVKGHELVRDQDVGHVGLVLDALHQPSTACGLDLVHGRVQQTLEHRVGLAERIDERLGAVDGARLVKGPLGRVGASRLVVPFQVAQSRPLGPQAAGARGLGDVEGRRWGPGWETRAPFMVV